VISAGASAAGVSLKGAAGLSTSGSRLPQAGSFLIWLIIVVLAANACSWNFTASRVLYSGGKTGVFPAVFGKLSKRNIPLSSLVTIYALSVSLITGCYLFKVPITALMLLVNQNFIFLCSFIIIAYWKTEVGWQKWIFSILSLLSLSFLASGFTWKVIYPVFLIGLGYFRFFVKKEDTLSSQAVNSQSKQEPVLLEDSQELS